MLPTLDPRTRGVSDIPVGALRAWAISGVYFIFRDAGGAGGGSSEVAMSASAFQDPSACLR